MPNQINSRLNFAKSNNHYVTVIVQNGMLININQSYDTHTQTQTRKN